MFSKLTIIAAAAMSVFVTAVPSGQGSCNKSFYLGNDVHKITSNESNVLFGLLGVLIPVGTNVGFTCSPITIVGVGGGAQCSGQTVCCENNSFNGVVAIGCTPIAIIV